VGRYNCVVAVSSGPAGRRSCRRGPWSPFSRVQGRPCGIPCWIPCRSWVLWSSPLVGRGGNGSDVLVLASWLPALCRQSRTHAWPAWPPSSWQPARPPGGLCLGFGRPLLIDLVASVYRLWGAPQSEHRPPPWGEPGQQLGFAYNFTTNYRMLQND